MYLKVMNFQSLTFDVYTADAFTVTHGVRHGDTLSFADDLVMDDEFRLHPHARDQELGLIDDGTSLRRSGDSGNLVHIDCCLTLFSTNGNTLEALVLVEVANDLAVAVYVLPLGEFTPGSNYRLIGVERHAATKRFAQAAGGSFARGTLITLASGEMRAIETLTAGDKILTRDSGPQPIRLMGQCTLRATGRFAPVVITKGALHNDNDLVLRPDHRVLVYQREDFLGVGRSEVLVKARHLIDGTTVIRREGGFVDYFQLVFDEHFIIFAEGIAAESHLINQRSRSALPQGTAPKNHEKRTHQNYEVDGDVFPADQTAALLRRASHG